MLTLVLTSSVASVILGDMTNEQFEKRLLGNLLNSGTRNLRITHKQEMKLREYRVAELSDKYGFSTEPLKLEEIEKYIDSWEGKPLFGIEITSENSNHYYVKK